MFALLGVGIILIDEEVLVGSLALEYRRKKFMPFFCVFLNIKEKHIAIYRLIR